MAPSASETSGWKCGVKACPAMTASNEARGSQPILVGLQRRAQQHARHVGDLKKDRHAPGEAVALPAYRGAEQDEALRCIPPRPRDGSDFAAGRAGPVLTARRQPLHPGALGGARAERAGEALLDGDAPAEPAVLCPTALHRQRDRPLVGPEGDHGEPVEPERRYQLLDEGPGAELRAIRRPRTRRSAAVIRRRSSAPAQQPASTRHGLRSWARTRATSSSSTTGLAR